MHRAADQPEPNPLREGLSTRAVPQPCAIVIFGATGDLTHRKLIPALYNLAADGELPAGAAIVGFARRNKSDDEFRRDLEEATRKFSRQPVRDEIWKTFAQSIVYHQSEFDDESGYQAWLNAWMKSIKTTAPAAIAFSILQLPQISSNRSSST